MFGWRVAAFGGPEVMQWVEMPELIPGPGQLRVAVKASGINFAETRMRAGSYIGQALPFVMGMESAGIVEAVGPGVTSIAVGDRVFGRARGSHATHVLFDEVHTLRLPESLSFVEGAAIPVGWLTAWHALVTVARSRAGERVLIEAIASSVGSAALQIAKWQGCWVAGTASRDDKCARGIAAGADAAYNYKTGNLPELVQRDTNGHGIDIGLMTIGEETAAALFDSMAAEGRIIMYGSTGGRQVCFNLNIGMRNLQLLAMSISSSARFIPESMRSFRELALPLFASGKFKAVVDKTLPMSALVEAHGMVDARTHFGKVVLVNP
ncbi:MAG: quinone oxidoreductase family protein [Steroidobacteraceae bacterium]|jgi:NADPH:quinone reductase-like Zn-dependent oxidoreductase